jgi:hypothetical protein
MRAARVRLLSCIVLCLLCQSCTHDVAFQKPAAFSYGETIPIDVAFFMKNDLKTKTYEGRAWSSGIIHQWVVPVGNAAHEYAIAYLSDAFRTFREIGSPETVPPGHYLLRIDDLAYWMEGQAAHSKMLASVSTATGREVLKREYAEDGPSGFGRILAAGAFAQKSAIRQSTHVVFENMFKSLRNDIRGASAGWPK